MEKFGIFELLDTLSAFSGENGENFSAQETPPASGQTAAPLTETQPTAQSNRNALDLFLQRQEEISRRIDARKGK